MKPRKSPRTWIVAALWLGLGAAAPAEEPLYRQEPFDRITINDQGKSVVLDVRPLDLPNRLSFVRPDSQANVQFRLLDQPQKLYEVPWPAIAKVELFEQILLHEALQLAADGKGDAAYDFFCDLNQRYPKLAGLDAAYNDFLYAEAKQARRANNLPAALAALRELQARDPQRAGLNKAIAGTTELLVQQHMAAQNYVAARLLLANFATLYPKEPMTAKWVAQLKQLAVAMQQESQAALAAGNFRKADEASRRLGQIWPQLPGAEDLARSIHQKYPRVVVAVTAVPGPMDPDRMHDAAARRCARLVHRAAAELVSSGREGAHYSTPLGPLAYDPQTQALTLQIAAGQTWSGASLPVTSHDVAARLAMLASPGNSAFRADLAQHIARLEAPDAATLKIGLAHRDLRPQALLRTMFLPCFTPADLDDAAANALSNGPYQVDAASAKETIFHLRGGNAPAANRPREIVERLYTEPGRAGAALRQGLIQAIDRVQPWELNALRGAAGVRVEPYGLPVVHCLLPIRRRPLAAQRALRRGLDFAIARDAILSALTGGKELPGCQVISGPFPMRIGDATNPLPAYDPAIEPRRNNPRLAAALINQAAGRSADARPELTLVLALPPEPIARRACTALREQLQAAGVAVQLKELPPGDSRRPADDVDLVYAELAVWEPLADAQRVLGDDGLTGGCSPAMSVALGQLAASTGMQQAMQKLRQIHRLAYDDAAIIPLWQWTDYFAYRENLKGIGSGPATLYENVEQWTCDFFYPSQQP